MSGNVRRSILLALASLWTTCGLALAAEPLAPSRDAVDMDAQINWDHARLIVVQHGGRYKTLESYARETMYAMYGSEHFPGLSPIGSLFEWMFNSGAYVDEPVLRIKHKGLLWDLTTVLPDSERQRARGDKRLTPRELFSPEIQDRLRELEPRNAMRSAVGKARAVEEAALYARDMLRIVPSAADGGHGPWATPDAVLATIARDAIESGELSVDHSTMLQRLGQPIPGLSVETARAVYGAWAGLNEAWLQRDAAGVQQWVDDLATVLRDAAPAEGYPSESQLRAEAKYYRMGRFNRGWMLYLAAALVGVWTLVTRWKTPWALGMLLLAGALAFHGYGLALRWHILGRVPIANMFEAVVGASWIAVALALVIEVRFRTRIFLFASSVAGFFALVMADFVIPGGGTLTTIPSILDDVMLRIHTSMVIVSYGLIFIAAVIAVVYLFGYYFHTQPALSAEGGLMGLSVGLALLLMAHLLYQMAPEGYRPVSDPRLVSAVFGGGALVAAAILVVLLWRKAAVKTSMAVAFTLLTMLMLAVPSHGFVRGAGWTALGLGAVWTTLTTLGMAWQARWRRVLELAPAALVAFDRRPILAGAAPGDEGDGGRLPAWLNNIDWCHLILLNLVLVLLFFGGLVLGAMWADYSWGRPWGWDPKETFALNTWLIYAILIHVRFFVQRRGLWTAWLSVIGCLMMLFNWIFVNFYVSGLHSYA